MGQQMTVLRNFIFQSNLVNPACSAGDRGTDLYVGHTSRFLAMGGNALQAEYAHIDLRSNNPNHFSFGIRHENEGGLLRNINLYAHYSRILTPRNKMRIGVGAGVGLLAQRFMVSGRRVENAVDAALFQNNTTTYRADFSMGISAAFFPTREARHPKFFVAAMVNRLGMADIHFSTQNPNETAEYRPLPHFVAQAGCYVYLPNELGRIEMQAMGIKAIGKSAGPSSIDIYTGVKLAIDGDLSRGYRAGLGARLASISASGAMPAMFFRVGIDNGILGRFGADLIYEIPIGASTPLGHTIELALHHTILPKDVLNDYRELRLLDR